MSTIRDILNRARTQLIESDTASLDVQVLLCHVLGVERSFLFAHDRDELTPTQLEAIEGLLARREQGEPVAYLIGEQGFYDLEFDVTPAVLIPRPETELLLEEALRLVQGQTAPTVADIGTGSGALAVTFARHRPDSQVYAVDISPEALAVTRQNIMRHQARVTTFEGNLAQPLIEQGITLDVVMANLPYIPSDVTRQLPVSRYEPTLALDGGDDGLDLIRDLCHQLPQVTGRGTWVLLEIGAEQGQALQTLVQKELGVACDILKDYAGLDRIGRFQL